IAATEAAVAHLIPALQRRRLSYTADAPDGHSCVDPGGRRIINKQRAIKQQQQQRASLLAQLKAQEEAIAAAARKLRETQDSLNQLNKQIDEMNAALAKLERQRASQERNLAAQLDAAFRQGPHTGIQMVLS
ncbi:hypothetical protein K4H01_21495, partial [Mycobacterium tuberculosis]|nr:hypothetical protein [Mycobacterium tuberculosis]